jgi:hypothetical protein
LPGTPSKRSRAGRRSASNSARRNPRTPRRKRACAWRNSERNSPWVLFSKPSRPEQDLTQAGLDYATAVAEFNKAQYALNKLAGTPEAR